MQVEKAFHGVVHEMAAIGVPPSVEAMQDEIQSHLEGTIEGDRFKRGDRPSKGFIQSFVCRGIKERAITMDTCIDDADRIIEWRHFENFEAYFDQVSLNLSHSAAAATFSAQPAEPCSIRSNGAAPLPYAACSSANVSLHFPQFSASTHKRCLYSPTARGESPGEVGRPRGRGERGTATGGWWW